VRVSLVESTHHCDKTAWASGHQTPFEAHFAVAGSYRYTALTIVSSGFNGGGLGILASSASLMGRPLARCRTPALARPGTLAAGGRTPPNEVGAALPMLAVIIVILAALGVVAMSLYVLQQVIRRAKK
jgi:hypothetical protein